MVQRWPQEMSVTRDVRVQHSMPNGAPFRPLPPNLLQSPLMAPGVHRVHRHHHHHHEHAAEEEPKRVFLIPWSSEREKQQPIVNFILVPEELLEEKAPLDVLEEDRPKRRRRPTHRPREKEREEREEAPPSRKFFETRSRHSQGFKEHSSVESGDREVAGGVKGAKKG